MTSSWKLPSIQSVSYTAFSSVRASFSLLCSSCSFPFFFRNGGAKNLQNLLLVFLGSFHLLNNFLQLSIFLSEGLVVLVLKRCCHIFPPHLFVEPSPHSVSSSSLTYLVSGLYLYSNFYPKRFTIRLIQTNTHPLMAEAQGANLLIRSSSGFSVNNTSTGSLEGGPGLNQEPPNP